MSEQSCTPVDPGSLPPGALISFNQFADLLPGVSRHWAEKTSKKGGFIPGVRLTPRSPMLFRAGDVAAYLDGLWSRPAGEKN
nr:hypothetical protein [Brevundimonas diminuta]